MARGPGTMTLICLCCHLRSRMKSMKACIWDAESRTGISLTVVPAHISGAVVGGLIHVDPQAIKFKIVIHTLRNTCIKSVVG